MKRIRQTNHSISGVFVFLLLGLFAIFSAIMVLIGAQVYKASVDRTERNNAERIAASYIRNKMREADGQGTLDAEEVNGSDVLSIYNGEENTYTILYVYDGQLYEWYTLAELADLSQLEGPSRDTAYMEQTTDGKTVVGSTLLWAPPGVSICPLDEMDITVTDELVTVKLGNNGKWTDVDYALRTGTKDSEVIDR